MRQLEPILTEKSLKDAKSGNYTFWAERHLTKSQIKRLIDEIFGVQVLGVRTMNYKSEVKKGLWGRKRSLPARRKIVVRLKEKQKIDLFEVKEK
jgi:large subunit ribosomal protein L23